MTEFYDKYSVHHILMQPVKLFGQPKTRDKIDVLNSIKPYADLSDIEYVYPLVFDKNTELEEAAAYGYYPKINEIDSFFSCLLS